MVKLRILMVLIITWGLIFPSGFMARPGSAIQDFSVEVRPPRVSARATYVLSFKLERALEVRDWIKVQFPRGTQLPTLSDSPEKRRQELNRIIESIYIGASPCSSCQGLPEINHNDNSITFNVHMGLDPEIKGYETIRITMTDRIGIVNPETPGWYELRISTAKESTPTVSEKYEILTSRIGDPKGIPQVQTYPSSSGVNANYLITFNLGRGGALRLNQSRVRIEFPPETRFQHSPHDIPPQWVQINDRPVSVRLMIHENILTFVTPINIDNAAEVSVSIAEEVGIINPEQPGTYTLKVATSEDVEWISSKPYTIEKSEPLLSIDPDIVSRNAKYQLRFLLEPFEQLSPQHPIQITFPEKVNLPKTYDASFVTLNEESVSHIEAQGQELTLYPSQSITSGTMTVLTFHEAFGIINPSDPDMVRLGFLCSGSQAYRYSSPVKIKIIQLQWKGIFIDPPNASSSAQYKFSIQLGSRGRLAMDDDIRIFFPPSSTYKPPPADSLPEIYLNQQGLKTYYWMEEDNTPLLIIEPRQIIPEETMIEIMIPQQAGIYNPVVENEWVYFYLSTSAEEELVVSAAVFVPPTLPRTQWQLLSGKEGQQEWFVEPPMIELRSDQEEVNIFYWWDEQQDNPLLYTDPILLDPGFYITDLNYYAESAYGSESIQKITFKVDTDAPYFIVEQPSSARYITNQQMLSISGKIAPVFLQHQGQQVTVIDQPLLIGEKEVEVEQDGSFNYEFALDEGENQIQLRCYDEAGNYSDRMLSVTLDTHPPELVIVSPENETTILTRSVLFKGKTSSDAQLMIQGVFVYVNDDGSFEHSFDFTQAGLHQIIIEATDSAGNITQKEWMLWGGITIILNIGSEVVMVNDQDKFIEVEPLIINSRTLVPLRLLAEEYGATLGIEFDAKSGKVIKVIYELHHIRIELFIGKHEALVNGMSVIMDVPAMIIRQRTLVPLRFVAESLQAEVNWNAATESIEIIYWKPTLQEEL